MKRFAFPAILVVGVFTITVLVLNYRENDHFVHALDGPPDDKLNGYFPVFLPETLKHDCPTCGSCEHTLELTKNRLELSIQDEDGWYRLFWAGDDVYYYDDPVYFGVSMQNLTAHSPAGTWEIEGRYAAPKHDHRCGESVDTFFLKYRFTTDAPAKTDGRTPFPEKVFWMSYTLKFKKREQVVNFGWIRESEMFAKVQCLCGQ